jgi:hypothetical protein
LRRQRPPFNDDAESEQLLTVPAASRLNPLQAVVDRRTAKLLEACPDGPEAACKALQAERSRRRGELGTRWYHCLYYPFRALPLVAGLASVLALLSTATLLLLPVLLEGQIDLAKRLVIGGGLGVGWFAVLGYACALLDCVLASSAAGEVRQVHWPGRSLGIVAAAMVTWLVSFVGGPIIPGVALWWFWDHVGDPAPVDKAIAIELGIVAVGYWILAILSVAESGRISGANPLKVADLAYELGLGGLLFILTGGTVAVAHFWWIYSAVMDFHHHPANAALQQAGCWLTGLLFATFFMRYLGLYYHRKRRAIPTLVA